MTVSLYCIPEINILLYVNFNFLKMIVFALNYKDFSNIFIFSKVWTSANQGIIPGF